ncbi:MAG: hypothetical protein V3W31_02000 [Thermodesulfobacteriota bacterium]
MPERKSLQRGSSARIVGAALLLAALSLGLSIDASAGEWEPGTIGTRVLALDVNDERERVTVRLDEYLALYVAKVEGGEGLGWNVEVVEVALELNATNLLYHSKEWHGPYPSEVFAWSKRKGLFPDVRRFRVRGTGHRLTIKLLDCETKVSGETVEFESGTIEIYWKPEER